uniref:Uncharacterized protein n=1 Tax=Candidatus Kentrum sp. MB TaxID=2138164 RepID=A0A450XKZ4_9GAMM|nr:MAG: hypothetical protein BECKMB1821G_GA0114241_105610 [Candidatus Kentron sp. MB]VFK31923.1 MAG: hypothetical protein BECKMB1821I_GA0114274_102815 [Candidatus Kentron sp. MB]VFK76175.1 MAG: hypothetical protein BECKMB1821H_GA0114242_10457 [Candidatus Kentron sp. MB]
MDRKRIGMTGLRQKTRKHHHPAKPNQARQTPKRTVLRRGRQKPGQENYRYPSKGGGKPGTKRSIPGMTKPLPV